ncbi:hypothetical protein UAM5_00045 [Ralstonia phage UAM5]|nr:hypothetical protein UAM5_00045 [Ralstonia phage UAM5]
MTDQTQQQAAQPGTDIALLPPPERAALVLKSTETEKTLHELVQKSADITAVIDAAGRELAHRSGMNLKNARVTIEKAGKAARDDANAFNSAVIAEQKRLIGITEKEEERIFGLRDGYDAKARAEKEERERLERERVAAIRAKIDDIKGLPAASVEDKADQLRATILDLETFGITEADFAEFADEAASAKDGVLSTLGGMVVRAEANEKEAARLAEQRAELERQQRELAEQQAALARQRKEMEAEPAPTYPPSAPIDIDRAPPTDLFETGGTVAIQYEPEEVRAFIDMGAGDQPVIDAVSAGRIQALRALPPADMAPTGYWCNGEYWGTTPDGDGKAAEFIGQELKLVPFWTHGREVTFVVEGEVGTGNAVMKPATPGDAADLFRPSLDGGQ